MRTLAAARAVVVLCAAAGLGFAAPADEPSAAERLVFLHAHLGASPAGTLRYAWVARAAGSAPESDHATLSLRPGDDGRCCSAHAEFLSGANAVSLPDIDHATANPIILYFLEEEVRHLQRETQGQAAHFRRQIRQALVDEARVTDVTLRWAGHDVAAQEVRVAPYAHDPFRARFEAQADTEYAFVLSDAVPGGVLRLSATLPGATPDAAPRARRELSLEDASGPVPSTPSMPSMPSVPARPAPPTPTR